MTLETNITLLDSVFLQEVDDEVVLLDTNTEEYFSLNEVGGIFYHILKEEPNLGKVLKILQDEFDIPAQELERDLVAFIEALKEKGLVTLSS